MAPRDGEISAEQRIESVAQQRDTVVKAYEIGRDYAGLEKAEQQSESSDDTIMSISTAFARDQIEPPYSPDHLCKLFEHSASLRQNVDAYMTNIDGFGHTFDPVIQLKEAAGRDMVRDAIFIERYEAAHSGSVRQPGGPVTPTPGTPAKPTPEVLMPTDEDIEARIEQLRAQMRMERARVESFFSYCVAEESFTSLRRRTRQDIEVTGNGYWEVIRNGVGEISQFVHIPSRSMRVTSKKAHSVEVPQLVRFGSLAHRKETFRRKFRRYLQTGGDHPIWFKEFGDPQILSSKTGKSYDSVPALEAAEVGVPEATEVFHFKIHALTTSAYGVPRWIGNLLSVLGSRAAEEVNLAYFDNKAIPPMAILVSGGRLGEESVKRIEDFVEIQIKGRKNFHKILVIEAETTQGAIGLGSENAGHMRVEIKTLTDAQLKDGLFLAYDSANMDKVGMGFRLPRLLRGDIRDFNRACYSGDTETLTEDGWKLHREIEPHEKIAVYDPEAAELRFEVPAAKHVYEVDEDLYRFESQHTDARVTGNHKMLVRCPQRGWQQEPAAFAATRSRLEVISAPEVDRHGCALSNFVLPKQCQIERGHSHEPIAASDWLEFLGYYLSDGGLLETDNPGAPYVVFLRQKKEPFRTQMQACLDRIGWHYSTQIKADGTSVFCISNRCLRSWLIEACGGRSAGRRMPEGYATGLPREQLKILWTAMQAGDGSRGRQDTNGGYYSASKALIDDTQIVALRLGLRTVVRWSESARVFQLGWSSWKTAQLRDSHVERERYVGEVFCFECPGAGFFVTRRNGKIAIQGNSAEAALDFAESQVFGPERNDFDFSMNRHVLPALGIHHWQFKSNGPRLSDSQSWGDMIIKLTTAGILTPEDARALTGTKVLSQELPLITADWIRQPLPLTIAGVQLDTSLDNNIPLAAAEGAGGAGLPDTTTGPTPAPGLVSAAKARLLARAKDMIRLRDAFRKQETAQAVATHKKLQAAVEAQPADDEIVIRMTAEELATNFGITRKDS